MQTRVGNRITTRLIANRTPQQGNGSATSRASSTSAPESTKKPRTPPSRLPGGTGGGAIPAPEGVAAGGRETAAPVAAGAAPGAGSPTVVPATGTVSAAGVVAAATSLGAPVVALANLTAQAAPGMMGAAWAAVGTIENQLSAGAIEKAPKGPMPTGLPIGSRPVLPQTPAIAQGPDVTLGGDPDAPEAIDAATQGGATRLEGGRHAAEQALAGDLGIGALAPSEPPGLMPQLDLKAALPAAGMPPIEALPDTQVAELLERVHGKEGRDTAARELGPAGSMLGDGEQMIDRRVGETTELLRIRDETGALEQVVVREEARMAVEQDKVRLRDENTQALEEYRRDASSERTAAEAEVRKARDDARKAQERARDQSEEAEDEAWYEWAWEGVKSGVKAAAGAVRDAVVTAYRFVKNRVERFFSKIRELVGRGIARIRAIGARIYGAIREKVRNAFDRITDIARRIGTFVKDVVKRASAWIGDVIGRVIGFFRDVIGRIAAFWRKVWAFAVKVKELIKLMANGAIQVFVDLIENTRAVIAKVKGSIQAFVDHTPATIQAVYEKHIAPLLDRRRGPGGHEPKEEPAAADTGGVLARTFVQRQRAEPEQEPLEETHSEGVWRHLRVRGSYFVDNWWDVVKDALFEILVPGVALYRHAPAMWKKVLEAWDAFWAGKPSQGWDAVLDAARELWAMVGVFIAQVSIAAFVIGSVLGTPIVGVAALTAIGLGVLAVDLAMQGTTIAKAVSNFDRADEDETRLEADYGRVADSSIAIVIMLVLLMLGAVAKATATALLRRFPALGRLAEGLKARVRGGLGLKPRRPSTMTSKLKSLDPTPPPSSLPVRGTLDPDLQLALDKWISERPAGYDPNPALKGKDAAALRKMFREQLKWVADQKARAAHNAQWQGEMLDPTMTNSRQVTKDVELRWNDKPPAEVNEGLRLNQRTGEPIALFGDDYPGIDGTIGRPPRPLQLKHVPATEGVENIPRVAGTALTKARTNGFSRLEVSIEAPGRTVAEVKAAFKNHPSAFTDGKNVSRVRVWCDDGVFEPTSFTPVPPPVHPNLDPDGSGESGRGRASATAPSGA